MALATSVTGTGKLISSGVDGSGSFSYITTQTVEGSPVRKNNTVSYTETRETRKWYALTESAATTYQDAHPSENPVVECTNEIIGAYSLTTETRTRTIVDIETTTITEA